MRLLALATLLLAGCGARLGSMAWYQEKARTPLLQRAAFELNCPAEELQDTPLSPEGYEMIGVRGCGRQASYKWIYQRGWFAETATSVQKD